MFTLFWAGKTFAPNLLVDAPPCMGASAGKVNIQDHLQASYLRCMLLVALAIADAGLQDSCVLGFDTFNEPNEGFLGAADIGKQLKGQTMNGTSPTPFEAMCLGEGIKTEVDEWKIGVTGPYRASRTTVDPKGVKSWKNGTYCVWKAHGVWEDSGPGGPRILIPDYFAKHPTTGKSVDVEQDFIQPFFYRMAAVIRSAHPDAIILIEPRVMTPPPEGWEERAVAAYGAKDSVARAAIFGGDDKDAAGKSKETGLSLHLGDRRIAYTPHWYDGLTLMNKHFNPWWAAFVLTNAPITNQRLLLTRFNVDALSFLEAAEEGKEVAWYYIIRLGEYYVRHVFANNVLRLGQYGWDRFKGEVPVVFGEYGLPYDMMAKTAYKTGDYGLHRKALDGYFNAMEHTHFDTTLWNYCASNNNEGGDNWNGEDLSIYSRDVHPESDTGAPLDHGGRALDAVCRPFASLVAGTPTKTQFDMPRKKFELEFVHHLDTGDDDVEEDGVPPLKSRTSEIFLPKWHYPSRADVLVKVSHGKWKITEEAGPAPADGSAPDSIMKIVWDCGCPDHGPGDQTLGMGSEETVGLLSAESAKKASRVRHSMVVTRRGHKAPSSKWGVVAGVGFAVLVVGIVYLGYQTKRML
jgi:hypothetical protein